MAYNFKDHWFDSADIQKHVKLDVSSELHILEIGSHEGKSTVWFIDNMLKHPSSTITCIDPWIEFVQNNVSTYSEDRSERKDSIYQTFLNNIAETKQQEKVVVKVGLSGDLLKTLSQKYDVILIDGNHTCKFVLEDSVLAFSLLKTGGYVIWDDYQWVNPFVKSTELNTPKLAIDSFLKCYSPYLSVINKDYKVIAKKIS
jgi:predicted O-methyltransferase YrrM